MQQFRDLTAARAMKAFVVARGEPQAAIAYAMGQGWRDATAVREILMASVTGMDSATGLTGIDATDLMPIVRAREIIGRLPGVRRVPFNVLLNVETTAPTVDWTGEGKPAPVSAPSFSTLTTLARKKLTSLTVTSEELVRSSTPEVETILSRDWVSGVAAAADAAFIDPANAGTAGIKPASITYAAPSFAIGGSAVADLDAGLAELQGTLFDAGSDGSSLAYVMHPITIGSIALMRGSGGSPAYPSVDAIRGGSIGGIPIIPSASMPRVGSPISTAIALVDGARIWVAEGGAAFSLSTAASLQMLDNPTNDVTTPTATNLVSLFQTGCVGLMGVRMVNWAAASGAAAVLTGVGF